MYADDTTIYFNLENFTQQNLNKEINCEIEKINTWLKVNRLSLNLQKTKLMIFHRKQKHIQHINIVINGMHIERVESFNFLGITLTETLCWDNHVNLEKNENFKSNRINYYRLKNIFPGETLKTLYTSLIALYLNHGLLLWGVKSQKVEMMQRKAIHLVTNSSYFAHTTPLFIKLNILKIQDMFKLKLLKNSFINSHTTSCHRILIHIAK